MVTTSCPRSSRASHLRTASNKMPMIKPPPDQLSSPTFRDSLERAVLHSFAFCGIISRKSFKLFPWLVDRYWVRRFLNAIVLAFLAVSVVFWFVHLIPGDPALNMLGSGAQAPSAEAVDTVRRELGLDQPLLKQYTSFVGRVLTLDLGRSFVSKEPITEELLVRIPRTLLLVVPAVFVAIVFGLVFGVLAATRRGGVIDFMITTITTFFFRYLSSCTRSFSAIYSPQTSVGCQSVAT